MKHKSEIFVDTFVAAVSNSDNWNADGVDWNFIDSDMYDAMKIYYDGSTYVWLFETMADKFDELCVNIKSCVEFLASKKDEVLSDMVLTTS
tara:strand:- start:361 stop:633 length:273 start_codon:yes stop_codon:yes gene_type:complete